ncbi:MAG: hypothetical protein AAFQ51_13750 [Pseudomonadota bacterium]
MGEIKDSVGNELSRSLQVRSVRSLFRCAQPKRQAAREECGRALADDRETRPLQRGEAFRGDAGCRDLGPPPRVIGVVRAGRAEARIVGRGIPFRVILKEIVLIFVPVAVVFPVLVIAVIAIVVVAVVTVIPVVAAAVVIIPVVIVIIVTIILGLGGRTEGERDISRCIELKVGKAQQQRKHRAKKCPKAHRALLLLP